MERVWSTAPLPAREQFAHWRGAVAEAFVPVDVAREGESENAFPSRVNARGVGPLRVSRIASEAQAVTRTAAMVATSPGDTVFLNLPLGERTSACQDGRTACLAPGDFAVVDSARPFRLGFGAPFAQVSLQLPSEILRAQGVGPGATAIRVDGGSGTGAIASAALRALAADARPMDRHTGRRVAEHVCGLIALALTEASSAEAQLPVRERLWREALLQTEEHLGDPDLCPREVAERIAVSPRYLHRLFAEHETTFGRRLLERRLERGRAILEDPARLRHSVGQIAHEVGFIDPSYFARAFRARYGMTPRQARAPAA